MFESSKNGFWGVIRWVLKLKLNKMELLRK